MDRATWLKVLPELTDALLKPEVREQMMEQCKTDGSTDALMRITEAAQGRVFEANGFPAQQAFAQLKTVGKVYRQDQDVMKELVRMADTEEKLLTDVQMKAGVVQEGGIPPGMMPGMQGMPPGMMPGMMPGMQGMPPGMMPGMMPGMQGMPPGMMPGGAPGMPPPGMVPGMSWVPRPGSQPPGGAAPGQPGVAPGQPPAGAMPGMGMHALAAACGGPAALQQAAQKLTPEQQEQLQTIFRQMMTQGPQSLTDEQKERIAGIQSIMINSLQESGVQLPSHILQNFQQQQQLRQQVLQQQQQQQSAPQDKRSDQALD